MWPFEALFWSLLDYNSGKISEAAGVRFWVCLAVILGYDLEVFGA